MSKILKDKLGRSKIPLAKSKLFWSGLILKLMLSCLFASDYLRELFAPFADYYIASGFEDPYTYFIQNGNGNEFPYPPLMLFIFSLPRLILWPIFGETAMFGSIYGLIFRLPLLAADFGILVVLIRWLKTHTRQVLIWYWLSPVLIYINYFHGQLDVIPVALLMASLYFLFKNKWYYSFIFLGMAIATKTNMLLVIPFSFIYMIRHSGTGWKELSFCSAILVAMIALFNLPFINSQGMMSMVYDNPVQRQVFDLYYQFDQNLYFYFIPAVYFVLIIYYLSFRFVNRDQLILFLAFTFLALTLMIAPMQGWYYWILPFLVYFVVKRDYTEKAILILLSFLYFAYFGSIPDSDYLSAFIYSDSTADFINSSSKQTSIIFTLLQTTLVLLGFLVFRRGIFGNIQSKFLSKPFLVGVGGDSASGKSTLSNSLSAVFEEDNTSIIRGDDMHKWERGNDNWSKFTHLDPKANKLHEELEQALSLKAGKAIKRRYYDHNTGRFTLPQFVKPNKLMVFEGLHSFYLNNQTNVYDLKIFMDPDEKLRMWWKVNRDVKKRGYTPEKVLEQMKVREEDSKKYIKTQASHADMIASYYPLNEIDPLIQENEPQIGLKLSFSKDVYADKLIDYLVGTGKMEIQHSYEGEHQVVEITGKIDSNSLDLIAYKCIPELEDIGIYTSKWLDDYEGVMQIFTTLLIFNKQKQKSA